METWNSREADSDRPSMDCYRVVEMKPEAPVYAHTAIFENRFPAVPQPMDGWMDDIIYLDTR